MVGERCRSGTAYSSSGKWYSSLQAKISHANGDTLASFQFNQPVKIKSISIFSAISPPQAPKTIQLFINQPTLDFSDAANLTPTQELVLTEKDIKGERVEVRFVKFQSVQSLSVSRAGMLSSLQRPPLILNPRRSLLKTTREMKRPRGLIPLTFLVQVSSSQLHVLDARFILCFILPSGTCDLEGSCQTGPVDVERLSISVDSVFGTMRSNDEMSTFCIRSPEGLKAVSQLRSVHGHDHSRAKPRIDAVTLGCKIQSLSSSLSQDVQYVYTSTVV